jgi:hypothetical protein
VEIGGKAGHHDRHAVDVGYFYDRAPVLGAKRAEASKQASVLIRRRDVQAMNQNSPMTLHFLREEASRSAFRDRLEKLVLGDEFCACHRTQRTHTLGTRERR